MGRESKRPFAVFDIDGTLIRWQLYHAITDALAKNSHIEPDIHRTIREARMLWKRRSSPEAFKTYQEQLVKSYEKALLGLTVQQFDQAVKDVFSEYKDQVYIYTRELIKKLKKEGYLLFAISGSQMEILAKVANYYGFDDFSGTFYTQKDNRFSGEVTLPVLNKDIALREMITKHRASLKGSIGVGDSLSDVKILELVEQPIAFNPEQRLFEHAKKKAWKIVIERKNMIYELQPKDGKYVLV